MVYLNIQLIALSSVHVARESLTPPTSIASSQGSQGRGKHPIFGPF